MGKEVYDFSGYATKANVRCSDGRIISSDAFKACDGQKVPLVYNHLRDNIENVIGSGILKHRDDGMYFYGKFNDTEGGKLAKELVRHGDLDSMSIYANHLTQKGPNVTHGIIREVSLVLAGANPGAKIENVTLSHSDGFEEVLHDEVLIYTDMRLEHSDGVEADFDNTNSEEGSVEHAEEGQDESKTVKEVFDSLTEDQKALFYAVVEHALSEGDDEEDEEAEQSDIDEGGENEMNHNVFEGRADQSLSHADKVELFKTIQTYAMDHNTSLSKAIAAHEQTFLEHGITDIESLFPDYKSLNNPPAWIGEPEAWVNSVWNGTSKTPFSRIKSMFADITKDEARARGYIKGKKKIEEQFSLLKRTTDPQTIYKLQKLDRDDVIDITDFDIIVWLKAEMRMKLLEEAARAILIGDGRLASAEDKIHENHIRPILSDDEFYSIKKQIELTAAMSNTDRANALIDGAAYAMIDYKGSGGATAFLSPTVLADLRVARDNNGRRMYSSVAEIASALGVSAIVEVPMMKDLVRKDATADKSYRTLGIIVNLRDYTVGADRGGQTTMFDDFDLNYNKLEYLIETRFSGALTRPASAIVLETAYGVPTSGSSGSSGSGDDEAVG